MFSDDDFTIFENHTTGIGSKILKRVGYEGKGLGINRQDIFNPIKVEELPRQAGLGISGRKLGNVPRQPTNHKQQMMRSSHQFFPTQQWR